MLASNYNAAAALSRRLLGHFHTSACKSEVTSSPLGTESCTLGPKTVMIVKAMDKGSLNEALV